MTEKLISQGNINNPGFFKPFNPSGKEAGIKKQVVSASSSKTDTNPFGSMKSLGGQIDSALRQTETLKTLLAVPYGNNLNIMG